jgi:hypothetical protein
VPISFFPSYTIHKSECLLLVDLSILNGFKYLLLQFLDTIHVEFGVSEMNKIISKSIQRIDRRIGNQEERVK